MTLLLAQHATYAKGGRFAFHYALTKDTDRGGALAPRRTVAL